MDARNELQEPQLPLNDDFPKSSLVDFRVLQNLFHKAAGYSIWRKQALFPSLNGLDRNSKE